MHPIIALWCHPRSMSTAIERIMRERGDLHCLHEPFLYDYYVNRAVRRLPHFERQSDQPASYEEACQLILATAETRPVFFKDMSYYVVPRIFEDWSFAERLTNAFLIRDPRRSIVSYHKLDPDFTIEEVGVEAQLRHVEWIESVSGKTPPIVEAEAITRNPEGVVRRIWQQIGLSDAPHAFSWSEEEVPDGWEQYSAWHASALSSTRIHTGKNKPDAGEVFANRAKEAAHLIDFLSAHQPAYEALRERAIKAG